LNIFNSSNDTNNGALLPQRKKGFSALYVFDVGGDEKMFATWSTLIRIGRFWLAMSQPFKNQNSTTLAL
jgi:hypothetical protein